MGPLAFALILLGATQDGASLSEAIDLQAKTVRGFKEEKLLSRTDDSEFVLRLTRDLLGRDASEAERAAFVADPDARKRGRLIDDYLARREFAEFWARRFERVFFGDPAKLRFRALKEFRSGAEGKILRRFTHWLAGELHRDRGWNEVVREILTARGPSEKTPSLGYLASLYRGGSVEVQFAQRVPSHFLGIRLWCASCHDHAFDRWRVEDFYGLGAFARELQSTATGPKKDEVVVERVKRPPPPFLPERPAGMRWGERVEWMLNRPPRFLFGGTSREGEARLETLARVVTRTENAQFPRATANRVWAWLMGRGIVHPPGDFNAAHRPISNQLLETVTRGFVDGGYSLKTLIRAIAGSETYQRKDFEGLEPGRIVRLRGAVTASSFYGARFRNKPLGITFRLPEAWVAGPFAVFTRGRSINFPYRPEQRYRVPDKEGLYPPAELAVAELKPGRMKTYVDRARRHFIGAKERTLPGSDPPVTELTGGFPCDPRFDEIRTFRILWATVAAGDSRFLFRLGGVPETVDDWRDDFTRLLGMVK